jgi:hypothetical protein
MILYTSRYQRFRPSQGAPVRTTVGFPQFKLAYELAGHARLISPTWQMVRLGNEAFYREQYMGMLDARGLDAIEDELLEISDRVRADRLVLLCFCDLSKPDGWCHRRMFAEWWERETRGEEEVPELAEQPHPGLF